MTELTHEQIRDILPDYLHGHVDPALRATIESHLHGCAECASEMRVLRMVNDAPSFAPMIDAVKVSSAILPYGGIPAEPARPRTRVQQMVLATAAVVLIAVTTFSRFTPQSPTVASVPKQTATPVTAPVTKVASAPTVVPALPAVVKSSSAVKPVGELQVAAGLDGLSDKSVAQLARELDGLDGLPSADPENLGVSDPTAGNEGGI